MLSLWTDPGNDEVIIDPLVESPPRAPPCAWAKFTQASLPPHRALVREREGWACRHELCHHVPEGHSFSGWQIMEFAVGRVEQED